MKIKFSWNLKLQDYIFIMILIFNILFVSYLGEDIYHEDAKLDVAKSNGEAFLEWAEEFKNSANSEITPENQVCLPKEISNKNNTWKDCVQKLFGEKGQFHYIKNSIDENNPVVSKVCDKKFPSSKGSFIFEKVEVGPAGASIYSPLEDSEILVKGLMYRLSVCDRGFYRIVIGETTL